MMALIISKEKGNERKRERERDIYNDNIVPTITFKLKVPCEVHALVDVNTFTYFNDSKNG